MINFIVAVVAMGSAGATAAQATKPAGVAPIGHDGKPKVVTLAPVIIGTPTPASAPVEPRGSGGAPWGAVVAAAAVGIAAGAAGKAAKDRLKP